MRKVMSSLFYTLDGVVEAPNRWQFGFDDDMGAALARLLDQQDAALLGRTTYSEWVEYWPTAADEPFASWINRVPKYVASTTLDSVDRWPNSTLIKGSLVDFVTDLRSQDGGAIGVWGSPTLVRTLFEHGLVDELQLQIHPVVGGGRLRRLFADDSMLAKLELIESEQTSGGVIIANYRQVPDR
ncbi:dihydrofolate reductase family protein [Asanoa sp. NPDC050611]|uniref:dihydrofolate reductase family protein n=1 Tax=Asanoa sp. NPDC050611 TaxID=3157098 RepID=UPI0033F585DD